jgi:hypothetical protein
VKVLRLICLLCVASTASRADAGTLYAATSAGGPGELYIIDQATGGVIQDVGPLNNATGLNYPITGLAFSPITGKLYGSTGNSTAGVEARLVAINPASALVTEIGSYNAGPISSTGTPATMADLSFDLAGNLYGVGSIGGPQLYSINTSTGQATVIGGTGLTSTSGGGLGISPGGVFYGTPTSSRYGTYDTGTGAFTNIVSPTRPVGGAYAALSFDGGTLYGLDLGPSSSGYPTELVTINSSGTVTDVAGSVVKLDAIAFYVPEPGTLAMMLGVAAIGLLLRVTRHDVRSY